MSGALKVKKGEKTEALRLRVDEESERSDKMDRSLQRTKDRVSEMDSNLELVIENSSKLDAIYTTTGEKDRKWWLMASEVPAALMAELKERLDIDNANDMEDEAKAKLKSALTELEVVLTAANIKRLDSNRFDKQNDGSFKRVEGYFLVKMEFNDQTLMASRLLRQVIDPAIQAKATADGTRGFQCFVSKSEADRRKMADKRAAKALAAGKGKGKGKGGKGKGKGKKGAN
jgi:hypothetical protein